MYYKIEDKESAVYKELHALRMSELTFDIENEKAIEEKTGLSWDRFLGHAGQGFARVKTFDGFEFKDVDKVNPKIWKIKL